MRRLPILILPALVGAASGVSAQEAGVLDVFVDRETLAASELILIADDVEYATEGAVARALGDAEAYYGARALRAEEIRYESEAGIIAAEGDVVFRNDDGSVVYADAVRLDEALVDGAIDNPKAVLPGGARLSAVEAQRIDGRYNMLSRAVYSACEVCEDNPEPLWQVRARRVVHDEEARDIIYEDAVFDVLGMPVAYLPYFRHPDPTVERRTGFLTPEFSTSSTLGYSVKAPYHVVLAPNRDVTVTPFIMTDRNPVLEGEYRALTERGPYRLAGSLTYDDEAGLPDLRGHLDAEGVFAIDQTWSAGFDAFLASDDTYLRVYDYTSTDRTTSRAFVVGEEDNWFAEGNIYYFQSYREDEPSSQIPVALPELRATARVLEDPDWGVATVNAGALILTRDRGRDVARLSASGEWRRPFILPNGLKATPFLQGQASLHHVQDDPAFADDAILRLEGAAGLDLRWPFIAVNESGTHIVEPVVQLVAATDTLDAVKTPNEDSIDLEFDETALFSEPSRFPGEDRWESGARLNAGVRYSYESASGLGIEAAYGRVLRLEDNPAFSQGSGLRDAVSDHVGGIRLTLPPYLTLGHRFRLESDDLSYRRNELYGSLDLDRGSLTAGYVSLKADPEIGATRDRAEFYVDGRLKLTEYISLYGSARRDMELDRMVSTRGGIVYADECLELDFSVSRRYNNDREAEDTTQFGLTARLINLGG